MNREIPSFWMKSENKVGNSVSLVAYTEEKYEYNDTPMS